MEDARSAVGIRIKPNMNALIAIFTLSEGVPGSLIALQKIALISQFIDPSISDSDSRGFSLTVLRNADAIGLYGNKAHVLFSHICEEDPAKAFTIIRAHALGLLPAPVIHMALEMVAGDGTHTLDLDRILQEVQEVVPNYAEVVPTDPEFPSPTSSSRPRPYNI